MERVVLDCRGEVCPMPVIRLAKAVESAPAGSIIEVLADDEGAKVDIPVWCRMKQQQFVRQEDREDGWAFFVQVAS